MPTAAWCSSTGPFVFSVAATFSRSPSSMSWIYLLLAGLFEIGFALGLKYTESFTRLWPTVGTLVAAIASLWLLTQALRTIPVGTAYAVWTGIGAVGVVLLGIVLFAESASPARLLCIA